MQLDSVLKLMSGSALLFACRITGAITVFVTQLLMVRWMGADEVGIYVLAFSWCLLLAAVSDLGYASAGLRFVSSNLETNQLGLVKGFIKYGRKLVFLSSCGASLIAGTALFAAKGFLPPGYFVPFLIAILCIPLMVQLSFHNKVAHAFSWFLLAFTPNQAIRPLLFLAAITFIWFSFGHLDAGIAMLLQMLIFAVVLAAQVSILKPRFKQALQGAHEEYNKGLWASVAFPLLLTHLFSDFFTELTIIVVGLMLPPSSVAIFFTCFKIALFIAFGLQAVNAILAPNVSKFYSVNEMAKLQEAVTRSTQLKFAGALLAVLVLIVSGKTILGWFGEEFIAGYPALIILAVGQLILASVGPVDLLLNLTGYQKYCLKAFGVALPVTIVSLAILVPILGITGAALGVILSILFWNIWLRMVVTSELGIQPSIIAINARKYRPH